MADEKQHLFHHHHQHHDHHHKEEVKPVEGVAYSETKYGSDGSGGYTAATETLVVSEEPSHDYEKERKHHKHLEQLGELGALASGAYALVNFFCTITIIYNSSYIFYFFISFNIDILGHIF